MKKSKWPLGVGVAMAALVTGGSASAHGDVDKPEKADAAAAGSAEADVPAEGGEKAEHEHEEERGMVGLDLVLGWGNVPFAVQNLPTASNPNITYTRADKTSSNVQSFIAAGSLEVAEHFGLELRVPFTFAGFSPNGSAARSTTGFGNVEVAGEYETSITKGLHFVGALGVALPTALGDEIPPDLNAASAQSVDATAFDRWSLSRAAAYARGYEDNALFEPHRLGLIPKVGVVYRVHGLSVEPYVKIENLIATSTALEQKYVGELVGGLRVGYWVHKRFELGLKGWVNVGYAGSDEDKKTAAAIEPQVVLKFGPVRPYAGVIVPVAGPPSENGFVGVRLGAAVAF